MNYVKNIERIKYADVAVIGGGTSGVFAAISAARSSASVVLIEKNAVLGGTMTVAGVNFPGLFYAWGEKIIGGAAYESIERARELGGAVIPKISYKPERHWQEQILLNKFIYTTVLFDMCIEAGVSVICNSMISDAIDDKDGLSLVCTDKSGLFLLKVKRAVDATADAALATLLGYPTRKSETLQPATLQNHISGYTLSEDVVPRLLEEIEEKRKTNPVPTYITAEKIVYFLRKGVLEIHTPVYDAETSEGKTDTDMRAHENAISVLKLIRSLKGFENTTVDYSAGETGIRETRRIVGEHVITAEEYLKGKFYEDSVCYAFYPIDKHVLTGIEKTYLKDGIIPKIPYRALIPKGSDKLLVAGRCISSDTDANSAIRVEAVCMATGEVAGCAAALSAKSEESVRTLEIDTLKSSLRTLGTIVPEE